MRLATDYERVRDVAARHGIELSPDRLQEVLDAVEDEREPLSAWPRVLEPTTSTLLRSVSA